MVRPGETVDLIVCIKCRTEGSVPEAEDRPGAAFYQRLAESPPAGVSVVAAECLSNCMQGCTIALRGPGRWTYVYGRFDPATDAELVVDGAAKYAATPDGLVPWRVRPEHFRKNCIARIPPLDPPMPNLGET
ncbi:MAG: DUF1636 domain-containing protein [Pseudomonadota bacterium]